MLKSLSVLVLGVLAVTTSVDAQVPTVPFEQVSPPPRPDYTDAANWVMLGAKPDAKTPAVFFVHPTTDRSMAHWNQNAADAANNRWTDVSVMARQAAIFEQCCTVYAPRYRQASRFALFNMEGDGAKAFDLAYSDVERAFETFLTRIGDRPYILVGHSQGAFHLARLMERKIDQTPLADKMIVAYVVGLNLSEGEFGRTYKTITICDTPRQTGCVAAWNAVLPTADRTQIARTSEKRYIERFGDNAGKTILCVNPLSFDRTKPVANQSASKGATPGEPGEGALKPRISGKVAARCDGGSLIVEPAAELDLAPLPGGSMHYHDLGLFFENVRRNVAARIKAFRKKPLRNP